MKRLFIAVLALVIIGLAALYILIPAQLKVSTVATIKANDQAAYRSLTDENNWQKWWPVEKGQAPENNTNGLYLDGYSYEIGIKQPYGMEVIIRSDKDSLSSLLNLIRLSSDSMAIEWSTNMQTGYNPFTKLKESSRSKEMKRHMQELLAHFKRYAELTRNVYGVEVKQTRVTDTLLVVKRTTLNNKPTLKDIYAHIADLNKYVSSNGASLTNEPMLNVQFVNTTNKYQLMVALPIDKKLEGTATIEPKRMISGDILFADVTGGEGTVNEALTQLANYARDHRLSSPGIPFQSLVTDRTLEPDTSKWVTRVYFPVK